VDVLIYFRKASLAETDGEAQIFSLVAACAFFAMAAKKNGMAALMICETGLETHFWGDNVKQVFAG
jgi:hypothetical protein